MDDFGWFEDFDPVHCSREEPLRKTLSLPSPKSDTPLYVLESSLKTQHLWYSTAGQRPRQPKHEREYFEGLWKKNFENSEALHPPTSTSIAADLSTGEDKMVDVDGVIIFKGQSPFSYSVSKSFENSFASSDISSMTLQMPRFRIIRRPNNEEFAEFLVIVSVEGVKFGVWKRHSHFHKMALNLIQLNSENSALFKNSVLSWQCLLNRKRWFKCLDKEYLSLKCFLLERFIHDLLFESFGPGDINDFLGLEDQSIFA